MKGLSDVRKTGGLQRARLAWPLLALAAPATAAAYPAGYQFCAGAPPSLPHVVISQPSPANLPAVRAALARLLAEEGGPGQARRVLLQLNGPQIFRWVETPRGRLEVYSVCQAHACADHDVELLYAPQTGQAWALHYQEKTPREADGRGQVRFLGHPDAGRRRDLAALLCRTFRQG